MCSLARFLLLFHIYSFFSHFSYKARDFQIQTKLHFICIEARVKHYNEKKKKRRSKNISQTDDIQRVNFGWNDYLRAGINRFHNIFAISFSLSLSLYYKLQSQYMSIDLILFCFYRSYKHHFDPRHRSIILLQRGKRCYFGMFASL